MKGSKLQRRESKEGHERGRIQKRRAVGGEQISERSSKERKKISERKSVNKKRFKKINCKKKLQNARDQKQCFFFKAFVLIKYIFRTI